MISNLLSNPIDKRVSNLSYGMVSSGLQPGAKTHCDRKKYEAADDPYHTHNQIVPR